MTIHNDASKSPSRLLAAAAVLAVPVALSACAGTAGSTGEGGADVSPVAEAAGASTQARTGLFSQPQPWTQDVSDLPPSDRSEAITGWLAEHGGWGTPRLRIEFSIKVLTADADTPFRAFTPTDDFYTPDCDHVPFPLPAGGALESEDGYRCTTDGDCHLLVVHPGERKLYEMWRADLQGERFLGGCAAVWDLDASYAQGRGDNCTSADAGGFPLTPMLVTADEVASGHVDHAIRFILPNSRIRRGVFVPPATHASAVLTGGTDAPPYGVRLRLRADFPMESLPTEGARVIARALQRHGMLLADGGHVPLTFADDAFTEHKWDEVGVDPDSVDKIRVQDMEVVDLGEPIEATGDCSRN